MKWMKMNDILKRRKNQKHDVTCLSFVFQIGERDFSREKEQGGFSREEVSLTSNPIPLAILFLNFNLNLPVQKEAREVKME